MLKPAQLYEEELQKKITESWYKPENMYWNGGAGDSQISLRITIMMFTILYL